MMSSEPQKADWSAKILAVNLKWKIVNLSLYGDRPIFYKTGEVVLVPCRLVNETGQVLVEDVDIQGFDKIIGGLRVYLDTFELTPSEDWIGSYLIPKTDDYLIPRTSDE